MVSFLLVYWRVEMLSQGPGCIESAVADVALPEITVECAISDDVLYVFCLIPFNLFVGNQAFAIRRLNYSEDRIAVHSGSFGT